MNTEVNRFKSSSAYKDILRMVNETSKSIIEGNIIDRGTILDKIISLINNTPIEQSQENRYGNKAFVVLMNKLDGCVVEIINSIPAKYSTASLNSSAVKILSEYLINSFGNRTRIDYGTGHELNYFCFLIVLNKLNVIGVNDIFTLLKEYFTIVRTLILKYKLEPAGSRGAWGIDDYQLLPFLFGTSEILSNTHNTSLTISQLHNKNKYLYYTAYKYNYIHKNINILNTIDTNKIVDINSINIVIDEDKVRIYSPTLYYYNTLDIKTLNIELFKQYNTTVLLDRGVIQHFIYTEYLSL
ncbi:serine/threonine-protein phosphatase 2A activator [Nematocida sp. AWRm80]|nr:serine/threonine-protein phosphatase 2A activator [Nematocida sp. AWRm80]